MSKTLVNPMAFAGAAAIALTATSCSTYEDGPSTSLVSKTNRLCREWQVDEYNGANYPYNLTLDFTKDGDFSLNMSYYGYTYGYTGTWSWNSDKSKVNVDMSGDAMSMTVRRLTSDEFWWTDSWGDEYNCVAN